MNSLFNFRMILISFLLLAGGLSCAGVKDRSTGPNALPGKNPATTAYLIQNEWIQLENGRAEWPAAPGAAARVMVALSGKPVQSDLDNDGDEDAVIFLTYQGGGSGTFFYIAAALQEKEQYRGTNGIFLGDRIRSPAAILQNGMIIVNFLDRRPDEPMTSAPSALQRRYFILNNSMLDEIKPAADESVYQGWLTIGHEVRSFQPCDEKNDLWLLGKSPALAKIISAYNETAADFPPYAPVFAILTGKKTVSPAVGFGADYKESLATTQLIKILPQGNCRSDLILLDSPLPGAHISSPLTIKGQARGTWFFEGDFPVMLLDAHGQKVAESHATAQGEWMTKNFVDFEGTIAFPGSFSGRNGTLILKKDNPTGLAEFDDFLKIPVTFE